MVVFRGITIEEYENNCQAFELLYAFHQTPFGKCLIAITDINEDVVYLTFVDDKETKAFNGLKAKWPLTQISKDIRNRTVNIVLKIFYSDDSLHSIRIIMKGTKFQIQVWQALIQIPKGTVTTYKEIAQMIGCKAAIAVGNAVSKNYIAYVVPCHRVTAKSAYSCGRSKYAWGMARKNAILEYEKNKCLA